jgi:hypothetical protein
MEFLFLVIVVFIIYLIYVASLPRPSAPTAAPPLPVHVQCPRCGTLNFRSCPNCTTIIPKGTLTCPACHITATSLPCRVCGTDLRKIP